MESKNFCVEKFLQEYNTFIEQLVNVFKNDTNNEFNSVIEKIVKECESDKLARGKKFYDSLESNELFELFCKSKVKLFSSKDENTNNVSNSLFGEELPLKKLVNNMDQKVKDVVWKYLHLFYFLMESNNENRSSRKSELSKLLKEKEDKLKREVKNDLLNVDVNEDTNNMIDDIVKSFEGTLNGNNANPFESIMDITQMITEKYSDKIENGDIELEKLMGSIQNNIPGMPDIMNSMIGMNLGGKKEQKEKVVIDENFSTDQVNIGNKDEKGSGMNLSNMLKMMNSMNMGGKAGEGGQDMGGLFSMLGKLDTIKTEEDAENLKKEMDSFLQNELGVDMGELNKKIESAQKEVMLKIEDDSEEANLD
jgi:hypothetical protein